MRSWINLPNEGFSESMKRAVSFMINTQKLKRSKTGSITTKRVKRTKRHKNKKPIFKYKPNEKELIKLVLKSIVT